MIAEYALANDATVLHYGSDFERVAVAMPNYKHEWIVPAALSERTDLVHYIAC